MEKKKETVETIDLTPEEVTEIIRVELASKGFDADEIKFVVGPNRQEDDPGYRRIQLTNIRAIKREVVNGSEAEDTANI